MDSVDVMILGECTEERLAKFSRMNPDNQVSFESIENLLKLELDNLDKQESDLRKSVIMYPTRKDVNKIYSEISRIGDIKIMYNQDRDKFKEVFIGKLKEQNMLVNGETVVTEFKPKAFWNDIQVDNSCCIFRNEDDTYTSQANTAKLILDPSEGVLKKVSEIYNDSEYKDSLSLEEFIEMSVRPAATVLINENDELISPRNYYVGSAVNEIQDDLKIGKPLRYNWNVNFYKRFLENKSVECSVYTAVL